jgi:hypothetical protein
VIIMMRIVDRGSIQGAELVLKCHRCLPSVLVFCSASAPASPLPHLFPIRLCLLLRTKAPSICEYWPFRKRPPFLRDMEEKSEDIHGHSEYRKWW